MNLRELKASARYMKHLMILIEQRAENEKRELTNGEEDYLRECFAHLGDILICIEKITVRTRLRKSGAFKCVNID